MWPSCPQCNKSDFSYRALLSVHPYPFEFTPASITCPSCGAALRVTTKSRFLIFALAMILVPAPFYLLARWRVDLQEGQFPFVAIGIIVFYYLAIWPFVVRFKPWSAFQHWLPKSRLVGYSVYLLLPVATIALLMYLAAKLRVGM